MFEHGAAEVTWVRYPTMYFSGVQSNYLQYKTTTLFTDDPTYPTPFNLHWHFISTYVSFSCLYLSYDCIGFLGEGVRVRVVLESCWRSGVSVKVWFLSFGKTRARSADAHLSNVSNNRRMEVSVGKQW